LKDLAFRVKSSVNVNCGKEQYNKGTVENSIVPEFYRIAFFRFVRLFF
jgi:hypothetical protein